MAKILILSCPADTDDESFHDRWQDLLAREAAADESIVRIVHNRATPIELRPIEDSGRTAWRGVTEIWFDGWEAAGKAGARLRGADMLSGVIAQWLPVEDRLMVDSGERPLRVKVMIPWRRKHDISREEAQDYWAGPHARFGLQDLGLSAYLLRYYQNHVVDRDGFDSGSRDGAAEFWVRDHEAFGEMGGNPEMLRQVAEDESHFMDPDGSDMLILEESEIYRRDRSEAPWIAV